MTKTQWIGLVLVLFSLLGDGLPGGFATITAATYVYEKDESGGVPPGVQFALREINEAGKVKSAAIDDDVTDATGNTPPQYKIAVETAKKAGLPALVVQADERVVKTVSAPLTAEQVMEATGQ